MEKPKADSGSGEKADLLKEAEEIGALLTELAEMFRPASDVAEQPDG
jgi:hypothetical protein